MRANKITTTYVPVNPNDLTNKAYVDSVSGGVKKKKNNVGYIPTLYKSTDNRAGFEVSASSYYPENYPYHAFSDRNEWTTNGENRDFWIRIKCPAAVAIWQFHLRGRLNSSVGQIYNWLLEGSNDNIKWTTLYGSEDKRVPTIQHFTIPTENTVGKYLYFRIYVFKADDPFPGLTSFQIYTLDDQI